MNKVQTQTYKWLLQKFFGSATLVYSINERVSITTQKQSSNDFCQIVNSVFNKCKSAVPSVFDGSASEKARFLAEIFSENFNLDDSGISLFDFSSRTNTKFHKSVIPKMVRNIITDLLHLKYLVLMVLFHQFHWWLWRMWVRTFIHIRWSFSIYFRRNLVSQIVAKSTFWSFCLKMLGRGLAKIFCRFTLYSFF